MTRASLLSAAAAAALLAGSAGFAQAERIGAVSAVNSDVTGEKPANPPVGLGLGDDLVLEERIESTEIGSGQFLFLDQTSLTVAPNSRIVLDRYVYDPAAQTGSMAITMTRGVLRFAGGRVSKGKDAVVTTPTATIGIRGGMSIIIVDEDGTTRAMHIAGEYTRLTSLSGEELVISRANGLAEVSVGGVIDWAGIAGRDLVRETTLALIGRGEAGQRVRPEDPDVVDSGMPAVNSEAKGVTEEEPTSTSGEKETDFGDISRRVERTDEEVTTPIEETRRPDDPEPPPPEEVLIPGATGFASFGDGGTPGLTAGGQGFVLTEIFEGSRIGVTADGERFVIDTPDGPGGGTGFFEFGFDSGSTSPRGAISGRGFFDAENEFTYVVFETRGGREGAFLAGIVSDPLPAAAAGQVAVRSYTVSDDLGSGSGAAFTTLAGFDAAGRGDLFLVGNAGGAATGGNAKVAYGFLDIQGAGATQTSGFGVLTGLVTAAAKGTPTFDAVFEGSFAGAVGTPVRVETAVAPVSDGAGGTAFGEGAANFALSSLRGGEAEPGRAFGSDQSETRFGANSVATLNALDALGAAARETGPGTALSGFAAGSGVDLVAGQQFAGRSSSSNGFTLFLDPEANGAQARISLDSVFVDAAGDIDPDLEFTDFGFGGEADGSALIDDRRLALRGSDANPISEGVSRANDGAGAFRGGLASSGLVGDGGIFDAGTDTAPEHLTWGWWAGEFRPADDPDCVECNPIAHDTRFHLGTWVAGNPTASDDLPGSGTATFEGFAVVSAIQEGRSFVDGAKFEMEFDFSDREGTATFTGLLGADATVAVSEDDGPGYSGVGGITIDGRDGLIVVDGRFFSSRGGDPARATAGSLGVGTNDGFVSGTGVFGGDRRTFVQVPSGPPRRN